MNKEIEAIKLVLREDCISNCKPNKSCELCEAEKLYNAGYRKTVWHKVADGDLPKEYTQYLCIIKVADYKFYKILGFNNNKFYMYNNESGEFMEVNEVLAWTELPEYKE